MPYADKEKNRECQRKYAAAHRDEILEKRRAAYHANIEASRALARQKNAKGKDRIAMWHQENKERRYEVVKDRQANDPEFRAMRAAYMRGYLARLREKVLDAYGRKCRCCGESETTMLAVDHVFNDGHLERNGRSAGVKFYVNIVKAGFPSRYQLLCHSCNMSKHLNKGTCQHKKTVWMFLRDALVKESHECP